MVLNPPVNKTPFESAYDSLSVDDKYRVKTTIMAICSVSAKTFYSWMHSPDLISKGDRFHIANILGRNIEDLFPKPNQNK